MFNFLFLNFVFQIHSLQRHTFWTSVRKSTPGSAVILKEHHERWLLKLALNIIIKVKKMEIFSLLVVLKTTKNQTWVLCFFENVDLIEN